MKIKKRVFCAAATFLILFAGVLGYGVEEVRADASSDFVDFIYNDMGATEIHESLNMDCSNHVVLRQNDYPQVAILGFYDDVSRVELRMTNAGGKAGFSVYLYSDSSEISYFYNISFYSKDAATSRDEYESVSVGSSGKYSYLHAYYYESYNFSEIDLSELIPFSDVDIYPCEELQTSYGWPAVLKYDISDPVYNSELGYLKNVTQKMISLNAPEGGIDYTSAQLRISFDGLSTTDVDLSTGEYKVRLYEQGCYYNNGVVSVYKEDYPLIEIGDYDIVDNSITFSVAEAFEKCTNETEGWLSSWDMFWIHCERSDNLYLQIIKTGSDGSEEYGGLVKLAYPVDSNGQIYSSTYFPDLTPDPDGFVGDKVDSGFGSGTNYDDAELNADKDLENSINNPNFSGDITNDMNSLISFIGAVPQLLAALLGFLPQHYKSLIYASIALALVLVVVKR